MLALRCTVGGSRRHRWRVGSASCGGRSGCAHLRADRPGGATATVLDLVDAELITVVASPHLLDELAAVLHRDKFDRHLECGQADQFIGELRDRVEITTDPEQIPPVSRDPDDAYLIALARTVDADAPSRVTRM